MSQSFVDKRSSAIGSDIFEKILEATCSCFPEHCTIEEHGKCWCIPEERIMENGNKVIIHNEAN